MGKGTRLWWPFLEWMGFAGWTESGDLGDGILVGSEVGEEERGKEMRV